MEKWIGVWKRSKTENYGPYLKVAMPNAPWAGRQAMQHSSITHDININETKLRVLMTSSFTTNDGAFELGADFVVKEMKGKKVSEKAYWDGDALCVLRVPEEGTREILVKRTLISDTEMLCESICTMTDSKEVTASKQFFTKTSPTSKLEL